MDKDNRDDFTFATLSNLKMPVTFRINQLEGIRHPRSFTELLNKPELRFHGVQSALKHVVRSLRNLSARRRQQTPYHSLPNRIQGIQKLLHVERVDNPPHSIL